MSGRYLLDTNIIIALFADEAAVENRLAQADEVFIPSIAVGKLSSVVLLEPVASQPYTKEILEPDCSYET